ncbi:histone-lysine N-methyltransferase SETMAR-like [Anastrepha ludens]|uniref:histone-lysine N-methyltransferase SETMAR-like n=1 Tax=Anastrepha ludens TaxID=28586 RepID=UPI0023AFE9F6|nr:histone-lysine N-methyltransferase SETMAR-like [Anastrepha ludens]
MDSEHCLELFRRNPSDLLRRFITMDETWIHHYTPQSNKQSADWLEAGQSRPKRPKTHQSAGKVLASIFWDACGVIFIDYLEKGKTVTGEYYASFLDRLNDETKKKRHPLAKKKVLFHQGISPAHKSTNAMAKLHELLPHPPYSPDLAPSDYWLFKNLKRWLQGQRFRSNEEVEWEADAYFEGLSIDHFSKGIKMLEDRWEKCIAPEGTYVEE